MILSSGPQSHEQETLLSYLPLETPSLLSCPGLPSLLFQPY